MLQLKLAHPPNPFQLTEAETPDSCQSCEQWAASKSQNYVELNRSKFEIHSCSISKRLTSLVEFVKPRIKKCGLSRRTNAATIKAFDWLRYIQNVPYSN